MNGKLITIGRKELISFTKLELQKIEAKIDTGAYTSSLHCHDIGLKEQEGEKILSFYLLDPDHPEYSDKEFLFEHYERASVKSSSGQVEERFKITTEVQLGDKKFNAEFTLTNRNDMKYPVLLGRKLLRNRYIVDVSNEFLLQEKTNSV